MQLTSALGKRPRGVPVIVIQPHELWKSETIWHTLWTVDTEAKQASNSSNQTYYLWTLFEFLQTLHNGRTGSSKQ
jgi:hypothetical protein